jgi:aspartate/methionine/tyrosine aminotransferase
LVPGSALYASGGVEHLVRFCFCKQDAVLDAVIERLAKHLG